MKRKIKLIIAIVIAVVSIVAIENTSKSDDSMIPSFTMENIEALSSVEQNKYMYVIYIEYSWGWGCNCSGKGKLECC